MDVPKSASFNIKQNTKPKLIPITILVEAKEHQALSELAQALYSTEVPNPMINQKQRMLPSPKVEELVLAAARQTLMNFIMEQQRFMQQQQAGAQFPGQQQYQQPPPPQQQRPTSIYNPGKQPPPSSPPTKNNNNNNKFTQRKG